MQTDNPLNPQYCLRIGNQMVRFGTRTHVVQRAAITGQVTRTSYHRVLVPNRRSRRWVNSEHKRHHSFDISWVLKSLCVPSLVTLSRRSIGLCETRKTTKF